MKRFFSIYDGFNKKYDFFALSEAKQYAGTDAGKVRLPSLTMPIVRQAPQIFYGSAFPNPKGRIDEWGEGKKQPIRIYQGASDFFLGPGEEIKVVEGLDLDFEAELAVITDAVPAGVSKAEAANYIRLLTACNDFTYRKLARSDRESGFGFVQSKPLTSFCAFGVLPSANKAMWNNGQPILGVKVTVNGEFFCEVSTVDMLYGFPELVAYCAKTRELPAGTIITSGAISTYGHGDACIAEKQRRVKMDHDMSDVDFLKVGDVVSIDFFVLDEFGKYHPKSLFGTLENKVVVR